MKNCVEGDVLVDVIQTKVAKVTGKYAAVWDDNRLVDSVLWFKSVEEKNVGLSVEVVEE
jgi:hypothetical protein